MRDSFKFVKVIISLILAAIIFLLLKEMFFFSSEKKVITVENEIKMNKDNLVVQGPNKDQTPSDIDPNLQIVDSEEDTKKPQAEKDDKEVDKEKPEKKPDKKAHKGSKKGHVKSVSKVIDTVTVRDMMINPGQDDQKLAFLTFDDGVSNVTTSVLDTLKEKGVNATFFIMGQSLDEPFTHDILRRMYKEGNTIATHSYYHNYELLYPGRNADPSYIVEEYNRSLNKMKEILGKDFDTKVWRYPGGHMSWNKESLKASDKALSDLGVNWIDWNTMNGDAQPVSAGPNDISRPQSIQGVIDNFEQSLTYCNNPDKVVVLMHDGYGKELTAQALPALIDHLRSKGYEFAIMN